ncbi:hypothetical protein C0991_008350 [Blastosporella zonata]|nr:hypothetical protein C0991_008350 [Blastosporella zonata]
MYSPYAAIDEYQTAPKGCRVIQANILQRHGARYPTSGASKAIVTALTKLSSVKEYTDSSLEFLRSHTYALGTDVMVPFGASQSLASGREHYERYKYLLSQEQLPFVRASSVERVVHTASNWTTGFSLASHHIYNPTLSVILYKDANTTLADSMCPNAGDAGAQKGAWVLKYASSIAARLNKHAPGANLTATDVYNLMNMCPFESVFYNRLSPFCNLFTQAEFEQLEYYGDLDKYYHTGYGQALGPVQGVGYINELIARLTGKPVNDNTQTNLLAAESDSAGSETQLDHLPPRPVLWAHDH